MTKDIIERVNHKGMIQKTRNFIKRNFLHISLSSLLAFNALGYASKAEAWPWQKGFVKKISGGYEIKYENLTPFKERRNGFFRALSRVDEPEAINPNFEGDYTGFFADYGDEWATFFPVANRIEITKRIYPEDGVPECFIVPVPKKNFKDYRNLKASLKEYHVFIDQDLMDIARKAGKKVRLFSIVPEYEVRGEWSEIEKGLYYMISEDADILKIGKINSNRPGGIDGDPGYWVSTRGFRIDKGEKEMNVYLSGRGNRTKIKHFENLDQYFR